MVARGVSRSGAQPGEPGNFFQLQQGRQVGRVNRAKSAQQRAIKDLVDTVAVTQTKAIKHKPLATPAQHIHSQIRVIKHESSATPAAAKQIALIMVC